jgi:sugar lactone lactonase YvrE
MALDEQGAIWVALVSGGIVRLTPDGDVDRKLEPPSAFTTSLCFAGRDLYVTTGGHARHAELRGCVLRTTVDVAGAPVAPARV